MKLLPVPMGADDSKTLFPVCIGGKIACVLDIHMLINLCYWARGWTLVLLLKPAESIYKTKPGVYVMCISGDAEPLDPRACCGSSHRVTICDHFSHICCCVQQFCLQHNQETVLTKPVLHFDAFLT